MWAKAVWAVQAGGGSNWNATRVQALELLAVRCLSRQGYHRRSSGADITELHNYCVKLVEDINRRCVRRLVGCSLQCIIAL